MSVGSTSLIQSVVDGEPLGDVGYLVEESSPYRLESADGRSCRVSITYSRKTEHWQLPDQVAESAAIPDWWQPDSAVDDRPVSTDYLSA